MVGPNPKEWFPYKKRLEHRHAQRKDVKKTEGKDGHL